MSRQFWRIFIICSTILASSISLWRPAHAQEERFFAQTGHVVRGEFFEFYQNTPNPELIYGLPITDAFIDPTYGWLVQYFQKGRLQLHPENPPELRVIQSPLGDYLYTAGKPIEVSANSAGCETIYRTSINYQVCFSFLDFFKKHGGIHQFGYPLSNLQSLNGRIIQHFQKARFEWHPENPPGQRVELAELGTIYFFQQGVDQAHLSLSDNLPQTILKIKTRAYTERAITGFQGSQVIYILVQDQNQLPIADAQISIRVELPDGEILNFPNAITTNARGIARFVFPFESKRAGDVVIYIQALSIGFSDQTTTSFQIWW